MGMPFSYSIDQSRETAIITWTIEMLAGEAEEAMQAVVADPLHKPHYKHLVDCRGVRVNFNIPDNRHLAAANAREGDAQGSPPHSRGKVAIVTGDEMSFGVASQFAAFSELQGITVAVFRDMHAAEHWLAVPTPDGNFRSHTASGSCSANPPAV